jgi:hypothetical protein
MARLRNISHGLPSLKTQIPPSAKLRKQLKLSLVINGLQAFGIIVLVALLLFNR